jgi:DnaJ-class molecular chaperone
MHDDYRWLGLPSSADINEVRRAYRELARGSRPRGGDHASSYASPDRLFSLHRAYETLTDPRRTGARGDGSLRGFGREPAFADEIDVDFPSVSSLVDGIRASFFDGADEGPLSTEVQLTPRQAETGVNVPIDVSLSHTCPVCGGRGEVWLESCGACAGSGAGLLPHQLQLVVPPGVRHGTRLRFDVTRPYAPVTRVHVWISVQ